MYTIALRSVYGRILIASPALLCSAENKGLSYRQRGGLVPFFAPLVAV